MSSIDELDAPVPGPGASPGIATCDLLVLGVGNVMMGDEGVGVKVARNLIKDYEFPPGVEVVDGGTGGLALLSFILHAREVLVIDAVEAGAEPGSIFIFPARSIQERKGIMTSLHDMGILDVLSTAGLLGGNPPATVIGVQPAKMDEFGGGLSPRVANKIPRVTELVLEHLEKAGHPARAKGS